MKFPDRQVLGTVSIEGAGSFEIVMQRAAPATPLEPLEAAGLPEDDLGAAWDAAEAALPDGWRLDSVERGIEDGDPWSAHAMWRGEAGHHQHTWGNGDTPAEALRALAARLHPRPTDSAETEPE